MAGKQINDQNEVVTNETYCTKCIIEKFNRNKVSYPKLLKPCSCKRISVCSECQQCLDNQNLFSKTCQKICCHHHPYFYQSQDHINNKEEIIKTCKLHEILFKKKLKQNKHCDCCLNQENSSNQLYLIKPMAKFKPELTPECHDHQHEHQNKIKDDQFHHSLNYSPYKMNKLINKTIKNQRLSPKAYNQCESQMACGYCNYPVYSNEKVYSLNTPWHKSCLFCFVCRNKLSPGKHAVLNNLPICHFPCMSSYFSSYQYNQGAKESKP